MSFDIYPEFFKAYNTYTQIHSNRVGTFSSKLDCKILQSNYRSMNFKSAVSGGLLLAFGWINSDNYYLGRLQFPSQDILLLFGGRNWYYANCGDNKGAINSEASIIICSRCPELD